MPEEFAGAVDGNLTTAATPEPATLTLLALGILGMGGYGWGKRRMAAG